MEYGLIGKTLSYSLSKEIHAYLPSKNYELKELNEDELESFFSSRYFKGINVTIPYKEKVLKYLDYQSEEVKKIGCANVIVNKDNKLYGYNTDYEGFKYLIEKNQINVSNKICYILGTGATSKTVESVLKDNGAKKIIKVSRNPKEEYISYDDFSRCSDVEIIVNTTPCGTSPNVDVSLVSLSSFSKLEVIIDVIYNPLKTNLILEAENKGIKAANGLDMLIYQAYLSSYLFTGIKDEASLANIYSNIMNSNLNIVLIGLPLSGKSTIGKKVAETLNKQFYDTDRIIEEKEHLSVKEIFLFHGEKYFRIKEEEIIKELSLLKGVVIATGGGAILNKKNMTNLKRNGLIIKLERNVDDLRFSKRSSRPLLKSKEDYLKIKNEREAIYNSAKDITIKEVDSIEDKVKEVIKVYYENISY